MVVCAVLVSFVPDRRTFYLIAASEMGEQAIQTPEVKRLREIVNKWLDKAENTSKRREEKDHDDPWR